MNTSFFQQILSSVMERGRHLVASDRESYVKPRDISELANAILSEEGEASGVALAAAFFDQFFAMDADQKLQVFEQLSENFGADSARLERAIQRYKQDPSSANAAALHEASEPKRQELIRRLNRAPGGTASLVSIREALLAEPRARNAHLAVDRDFRHLFSSWFNRGFLVLERIDWASPAVILEKVIRYEAVHEIRDWSDLRRRIDRPDRQCYAFFHPALADEPLIFVQVALTGGMPNKIEPLLSSEMESVDPDTADTAVFYSISNCQAGLKGVTFGNFLIKQVVRELSASLPNLTTFVTLSPVPRYMSWLQKLVKDDPKGILSAKDKKVLAALETSEWHQTPSMAEGLKRLTMHLAAVYFLNAKSPDGKPVDPVCRFHLGNGASLARINWMGDISEKALRQSAGLMVNYLYDLNKIEENHENFAKKNAVAASAKVRELLRSKAKMKSVAVIND